MSLIPNDSKKTTIYLLNQILKLLEKHFSTSKNLDTSAQSKNLIPYITEYRSYKGIHEPFLLDYLKIDHSNDVGTMLLNLELRVNDTIRYSFYLCWAEDVFEKGIVLKEKYVWSSSEAHNYFPNLDKYSFEITEELNGYSCNRFDVFAKIFERILNRYSKER